jgi:hypothetical protein
MFETENKGMKALPVMIMIIIMFALIGGVTYLVINQ